MWRPVGGSRVSGSTPPEESKKIHAEDCRTRVRLVTALREFVAPAPTSIASPGAPTMSVDCPPNDLGSVTFSLA